MNNGYQISHSMPSSNGFKNYSITSNDNMQGYYVPNNYQGTYQGNDERLLGGFAFPFLLGGVTGAALAPNFWRPNYGYRPPYYYPPAPYPYPYPPRRWF